MYRAVGLLIAGVVITGCSAGVTTADQGSGSPAAPSSAAAPSTTAAGSGGISVPSVTVSGLPGDDGGSTTPGGGQAALPAGFPLPPGATVTRAVDDGGEIAATLTVTDPAAAANFWKAALPRAGYVVTSNQSVGGFGEIRFSGHGCGGDSQLAIQGTTVALQCDRG